MMLGYLSVAAFLAANANNNMLEQAEGVKLSLSVHQPVAQALPIAKGYPVHPDPNQQPMYAQYYQQYGQQAVQGRQQGTYSNAGWTPKVETKHVQIAVPVATLYSTTEYVEADVPVVQNPLMLKRKTSIEYLHSSWLGKRKCLARGTCVKLEWDKISLDENGVVMGTDLYNELVGKYEDRLWRVRTPEWLRENSYLVKALDKGSKVKVYQGGPAIWSTDAPSSSNGSDGWMLFVTRSAEKRPYWNKNKGKNGGWVDTSSSQTDAERTYWKKNGIAKKWATRTVLSGFAVAAVAGAVMMGGNIDDIGGGGFDEFGGLSLSASDIGLAATHGAQVIADGAVQAAAATPSKLVEFGNWVGDGFNYLGQSYGEMTFFERYIFWRFIVGDTINGVVDLSVGGCHYGRPHQGVVDLKLPTTNGNQHNLQLQDRFVTVGFRND